ncbi:AFR247Wp [Eremothecium gossypii ATCC 10895]|uniref:AFR247Wp n=1 Tax=Eremothecium gossypii (strain ATCC 10895 / CBS 109.51 / FGSC 9923 / NRRL Y-1056) TaxID=284811 RepID=Q753S9_EREGS|nr:AFR247Wp [Eremothecium gossypii ATCC 10895]AAS53618.1 AFR247Wp [Eremothecium gossypii ATCC 10895]AEY97931.1 FAFR247Wp [Eremothecium gossypii FDAG1]
MADLQGIPGKPAHTPNSMVSRAYQFYRLSCMFLYAALVARWLALFPLVGTRWVPGGIHGFLIYLLGGSAVLEVLWMIWFYRFTKGLWTRTLLKCANMLYFVAVMHFYDDYEHAPVLKNIGYSIFILSIGMNQALHHGGRLFRGRRRRRSWWWRSDTFVLQPALYISQFYLLLLNVQNPSFHSTPKLDIINRTVLVAYVPLALQCFRRQLTS